MPLRDHFHSPVTDRHSWDAFHAMWPAMIVRELYHLLPPGFVAAPGVHIGRAFEIDVSTYETDAPSRSGYSESERNGGVATLTALEPTTILETDLLEQDEYEVRIVDAEHGRRLVAAIEIVSPDNKDRPEHRRAFVAKVAALLQQEVCVSIVDLVTSRQANLYVELLELLGRKATHLGAEPTHLYAVTLSPRKRLDKAALLDVWFWTLKVGEPLPTLPIWLAIDQGILLPLESSYLETCKLLRIDSPV